MKISVKVKPGSKQNYVEDLGQNRYIVRVKEKAVEGRANEALVEILSEYFGLHKRNFSLIKGSKSRDKIIEIKQ